jgi:hypothetical protein
MTATVTGDVQEQVLGVVRKSQEMTLDAIRQVVETVNAAARKLPAMPFADRLPFADKLPSAHHLPGASALPAPETVVSAAFDFIDRLVAEQRKFAGELVKVTAPLRTGATPAAAAPEAATE